MSTATYIKAIFSGQATPTDVWNVGIYYNISAQPNNLSTLAGDMLAAFNTKFWSESAHGWNANQTANCTLSKCSLFRYNTGQLVDEGSATITPIGGSAGGASPSFTAAVFTLNTGLFGKSHRGRLYLPHTAACTVNGQMQVVQGHADNMKNFLDTTSFTSAPGVTLNAAVFSRKLDTLSAITKVRVDTKPDTQRGRIGKMVPTGTFSSVL